MLVLLPPSEGKAAPPVRGKPLDLATLSFPALGATREQVLDTLVGLCRRDPRRAAEVLELGPKLEGEVAVDAALRESPTRPARALYTGVLYAALGLDDLPAAASRRATARLAIASGLWGLVRIGDRLPRYRLPGGVSLPGLGTVASIWKPALATAGPAAMGSGLLLDLRSTTYAAAWTPAGHLAARSLTVRVLHAVGPERRLVSEANKAVKGRLTRALLLEGSTPRTVDALIGVIDDIGALGGGVTGSGWSVEESTEPGARRRGGPRRIDLIATDLSVQTRLDTCLAASGGMQAHDAPGMNPTTRADRSRRAAAAPDPAR